MQLYLKLEKLWFTVPQKLRFLLVGGFNTVFAYLLFNLLYLFFLNFLDHLSQKTSANLALLIQYIITINLSFFTMRYYVFQSHGHLYCEWIKALSVYFFMYLINAPILTFLIVFFNWPAWLAQGAYLIFSTILTFVLHKYYSFRKI